MTLLLILMLITWPIILITFIFIIIMYQLLRGHYKRLLKSLCKNRNISQYLDGKKSIDELSEEERKHIEDLLHI